MAHSVPLEPRYSRLDAVGESRTSLCCTVAITMSFVSLSHLVLGVVLVSFACTNHVCRSVLAHSSDEVFGRPVGLVCLATNRLQRYNLFH